MGSTCSTCLTEDECDKVHDAQRASARRRWSTVRDSILNGLLPLEIDMDSDAGSRSHSPRRKGCGAGGSFFNVVRLISSIPDSSPASFNLSELGSVSGQSSPTGRGSLFSALGWSNRPPTTDAPLLVGKGNHSLGPLLVQRQKTLPMNPSSEGHSEAEWYCGDAAERGVVRANSLPDPECAPDSAPPPTTETVGDVAWRSSGSRASFDAVPEKESPNVVSI
mmetsp:Transcript_32036/g.102511  ORF Transcript_32036/g.102511 Transcript_32036/m.102511 type:complete len:221 (+) Transcript_32036:82-744(+)